ncbi:hypothetical protein QSJ18_18165 [Gordonia sp. ABSL1-1]|uniref:hypothetical protein n=1 Tax=Gordonia sp. ABSL1-1 TaxID=3053923 RepID=UPI0025744FFF|nr:hypothetical protein [Gordonia sp. ABSL1-1]MDL9938675.1 hypothetical protein [Gordonia sp. ABSL1-1]
MTDNKNERIEKLTGALITALLTANQQPYPMPVEVVRNIAAKLDDFGVRQTGEIAADVEILPGWVAEKVREQTAAAEVADRAPVDHFAPQETPAVRTAPKRPARIPKKLLGVVRAD